MGSSTRTSRCVGSSTRTRCVGLHGANAELVAGLHSVGIRPNSSIGAMRPPCYYLLEEIVILGVTYGSLVWRVCNPAAPAGVRGIPGLSPGNVRWTVYDSCIVLAHGQRWTVTGLCMTHALYWHTGKGGLSRACACIVPAHGQRCGKQACEPIRVQGILGQYI